MMDVEYFYVGGPYDGQWRRPFNFSASAAEPERYRTADDQPIGRYIPTKLGHMALFGEGEFRMTCRIMLDEPWHDLITGKDKLSGLELSRANRLGRAIVMQAFREHLQRTWRAEEALAFGPMWTSQEHRP